MIVFLVWLKILFAYEIHKKLTRTLTISLLGTCPNLKSKLRAIKNKPSQYGVLLLIIHPIS